MNKLLHSFGFIFIALAIMAPNPNKAEKLKIENTTYDKDSAQLVVSLSCQFGMATAGEHADFTLQTELYIKAGETTYTEKATGDITKVAGATKDADGYIKIQPTTIKWDSQGFSGDAEVTTSISLVGPSGNVHGDAIVATTIVKIEEPGDPCPGEDCPAATNQ